ncbi:GNAT family N-acetyltransferase [Rhodobacterales bacterium]|nr:GNAT family N-acetyltransferase [Rhodobacterales bacterium]
MSLKLRPATLEDSPILTDILKRSKASRACSDNGSAGRGDDYQISDQTISAIHMTVAEQNGKPVGFSGLSSQKGGAMLMDFLFVAPEAQRQGIGELLLIRAEDHTRWTNHRRLRLEAETGATGFYEKRGFSRLASRPSQSAGGDKIPLLEKDLTPPVKTIRELNLTISTAPWAFELENDAAILHHFEEAKKRIGMLWNGRTLKLTGFRFEDGIFEGVCTECSYAAFLTWRDWGAPDTSAFNLFGSAILRSSDGALLYGVMSDKTATAGQIYAPGGNLDPTDLKADGTVDVVGAIYRELEEETGLTPADLHPGELLAAFDGPRISIAKVLDSPLEAEDLRRRIMDFSLASEEQELADVRIIRTSADLGDCAIVPYARAIASTLLS